MKAADRLAGGPDAVPAVDDAAPVERGRHSVGVKRQSRGRLGKRANRRAPVSLTPARAEVPVGVGLRPFLPEECDAGRRAAAGVPGTVAYRPKRKIALDETDRVPASGARFGHVPADAEHGGAAELRAGLAERRLPCAVGIPPTRKVYPAGVTLALPEREATGRPRKHPVPSAAGVGAAELIGARPEASRAIPRRTGTEGPLGAELAAVRARVADAPAAARGRHPPGEGAWPVGEHRATGERKHCLPDLPAETPPEAPAALIKARRVCEQAHRRPEDEPGLDRFEGRSRRGLHRHALLCLLAFAFLPQLRLGGKSPAAGGGSWRRRPAPRHAVRAAGGASSTTSGPEAGGVALP